MSGYIGGILIHFRLIYVWSFIQPEIKKQNNNIERHGKNAFCNEQSYRIFTYRYDTDI